MTFTYVTTDTYEVVNAWATGNADNPVSLNAQLQTVTTKVGVNAALNGDPRKVNGQQQFTGFILNEFTSKVVDGTIPVVSPTVTYVTFTWTTQEPTGNWITDPVTGKKVKEYVPVTHESDQVPAYISGYDESGKPIYSLYTEGNNKAVLSVTLLDSTGGLYANYIPGGNSALIWSTP